MRLILFDKFPFFLLPHYGALHLLFLPLPLPPLQRSTRSSLKPIHLLLFFFLLFLASTCFLRTFLKRGVTKGVSSLIPSTISPKKRAKKTLDTFFLNTTKKQISLPEQQFHLFVKRDLCACQRVCDCLLCLLRPPLSARDGSAHCVDLLSRCAVCSSSREKKETALRCFYNITSYTFLFVCIVLPKWTPLLSYLFSFLCADVYPFKFCCLIRVLFSFDITVLDCVFCFFPSIRRSAARFLFFFCC
jgi:hypothetical protein